MLPSIFECSSPTLTLKQVKTLIGLKTKISIELNGQQIYAIIGANGAGKSSLLRAICGLNCQPNSQIEIDQKKLPKLSGTERAQQLAFLPQMAPLNPLWIVQEVLEQAYIPHKTSSSLAQIKQELPNVIDELALGHLLSRTIQQLSGGERQRVLLARSILQSTRILLLDEPLTALDLARQEQVMNYLRRLCHQYNLLIVMVMHDLNLAALYTDQIIFLDQGHIALNGLTSDLLTQENITKYFHVELHPIMHPSHKMIQQWLPKGPQ